jgi:hypothetical protein
MHPTARWLFPLILLVAVAAGGYWLWQKYREPPVLPPVQPAAQPTVPPVTSAPAIQHPIEEAAGESKATSLPALAESDPAARDALGSVFSKATLDQYFLLDGAVRRVVATVDALPRKSLPQRVRPMKPVPGQFMTKGQAEGLLIAPENAARYAPYIRVAEMVDTKKLVAAYVRLYPLFQQAYAELGYPTGYFNDRLIAAIDDMLSAPEAPVPTPLTQPKVLYAYADPELEALSAGQKIMLRMGNENAARAKAKLRDLRLALTAKSAQPSP